MLIKITKASDSNLEENAEYREFKTLEELFKYARKLGFRLIISYSDSANEIMIYDAYIE